MASPRKSSGSDLPRRKPATTPEARENQMINLAFDQAELQLREGTAPAPIVIHYLKLGTERDKLEREKMRRENILLERKAEQLESAERIEELYSEAISAMREYRGIETIEEDDPDGY